MDYANQIIDAIQTIAQNEVAGLKFDKTIRASIIEATDPSIGKYRVRYQNSSFYAYALDLKTYAKGANVYVVVPSSDFEKDPYIMGTIKKLGADFVEVLKMEDKMSLVGDNIILVNEGVEDVIYLSSYKPEEQTIYRQDSEDPYSVSINQQALEMYKQDSEYMMIGAKFTTSIPEEQKIGSGDYGIRITCRYWDSRYKSAALAAEAGAAPVIKSYTLNVKNMTGQPYNYTSGNEQHAIFPIDSEHLLSIDSISAFCQDFPNENHEAKSDIIVSNFKIEFYDELSESEIQGISLRITTPHGGFFYQRSSDILPTDDDGNPGIKVDAVLRIKGKRVNPDQKVSYYWFVRDDRIQTDSDEGYHRYGGPGWRCINSQYQTATSGKKASYIADNYSIYIPYNECPAYQNYTKCTAVFEQDSNMTVIDTEKVIYNTLVVDNNNIYIESMMGTVFNFNTGLTELKCRFKNEYGINYNNYDFIWTRSIDGQDREAFEGNNQRILSGINISLASSFVTYSCSVYEKGTQLFVGAAEITLSNETVQGEYRLVLHNGTQVFKYDAKGVSPASPSVDEQSRLDLGAYALSFDIYDDKGQRIDLGSDENKHRIVDIKWIWPSTNFDVAPDLQRTDFESMLLPEKLDVTKSNFELETIPSPYDSTHNIKRWIRKDQANLSYQIQSRYDSGKINNNIQLEVIYKGYILTASTNFTFTKEGELGTNGTKYIARIIPKNYDKIIISGSSSNNGFFGVKNNIYTKINESNLNNLFSVQVWDGGVTPINTSSSNAKWTTVRQDRNQTNNLVNVQKVNDIYNLQLVYNANRLEQNHTLKAEITIKSIAAQPFYCEYPLELYQLDVNNKPNYIIEGGYRHCNYESDGTRAEFSTNGFKLVPTSGSIVTSNIKWTTKWSGDKYTVQIKLDTNTKKPVPLYKITGKEINGYNNVVLEAPAYFEGRDIDNYVSCRYNNQIVAVIPISLCLNKFGLSAINGWDGTSIKLNEEGQNYILTPQMGAGQKTSDGSFTGIVAGTSMDTDGEKVGLFGYNQGHRSIWLDSKTGNAEFGIRNNGQILIDAVNSKIDITNKAGDGMTLNSDNASLQSHNYSTTAKTGMQISLSEPYIKFGSGNFSVNKQGNLIAKGGGSIAGWSISDTRLSHGNDIYLDSSATGNQIMFKAGNNFTVQADGTIMAKDGTIANWNITSNVLKNNNLILDSGGKIAGGINGAVSFTDSDGNTYNNKRWKIESNGVATFSDIEITNDTSKSTQSATKKLIDIKKGSDTKFSVDNEGSLLASSANVEGTITAHLGNIGGWTIDSSGIHRDNFYLTNSGSVSLGNGFTVNSSSISTAGGSTGGGTLSGTLGSNSGSSILGNDLGSTYDWEKNYKLAANLETSPLNIITGGSVTVDGKQYTVNFTKERHGAVITSFDIYNADFLGSASRA